MPSGSKGMMYVPVSDMKSLSILTPFGTERERDDDVSEASRKTDDAPSVLFTRGSCEQAHVLTVDTIVLSVFTIRVTRHRDPEVGNDVVVGVGRDVDEIDVEASCGPELGWHRAGHGSDLLAGAVHGIEQLWSVAEAQFPLFACIRSRLMRAAGATCHRLEDRRAVDRIAQDTNVECVASLPVL
eukprot:scaffold429_cov269-Pinguiococcus_pyrenoidosus.AAC.1